MKHKFKVGDIVTSQGARLKIVKLIKTPAGFPGYEMVSPATKGDPWLVDEAFLSTCRKLRTKKL